MLLYRDVVSGDEMLSDAFKIEDVPDLPNVVRVKVKNIEVKTGVDESAFGFNASAEGEDADAGADDAVKTVIDIVEGFDLKSFDMFHDLQETAAKQTKKFMSEYLKKYLKLHKEKHSTCCVEKKEDLQKDITALMAFVKKNWSNVALFTGRESEDTIVDGSCSVCFLTYSEEGYPEYMYYCKHFLSEEKA